MKKFKLLLVASAILSLSSVNVMANDNMQSKTTIGQRIDDAKIVTVVKTDLVKDKELSAMKINVDSTQGKVVLRGTAPSATAKERAETIAKGVNGVASVDNKLTVGENITATSKDYDNNVKNTTSTTYNNTKNSVANTTHEVNHDVKNAANKAGKKIDDATINTAINAQLAGDSDLSALKINVDVKNSKVWLKGEAPSMNAKNRATEIAKSIDGVTSVNNQLKVTK